MRTSGQIPYAVVHLLPADLPTFATATGPFQPVPYPDRGVLGYANGPDSGRGNPRKRLFPIGPARFAGAS